MPIRPEKLISVIVPARNEEALISLTIEAILRAAAEHPGKALELPHLDETDIELIVVDNRSTDKTPTIVEHYVEHHGVRLYSCANGKTPNARNLGARHARGRIFVFIDADTIIPLDGLRRIHSLCETCGYQAGIARLASLEPGLRAWCWWTFWEHVRRLPLAQAKAMPALMFCTRSVFLEFGPFDEQVVIGEEWPILAGLYRARPNRLAYDRSLTALSSSRRMELQRFGYSRTLLKYVWAILHTSGRIEYSDTHRHTLPAVDEQPRTDRTS